MISRIQKINPLDLQPRKAIGISIPFSAAGVFNSTYQSKDAIRVNLINFFLTGVGERFMNPTFGAGLRNLLFEQLTSDLIRKVDSKVRLSLSIHFPKVKPLEISLEGEPDSNLVTFYMRYEIVDTNIDDELLINFER